MEEKSQQKLRKGKSTIVAAAAAAEAAVIIMINAMACITIAVPTVNVVKSSCKLRIAAHTHTVKLCLHRHSYVSCKQNKTKAGP